MIFLLRFMLKLLFAPVSLVLALFVWFFTWLVCVSSVVLGLASTVLSLLALAQHIYEMRFPPRERFVDEDDWEDELDFLEDAFDEDTSEELE